MTYIQEVDRAIARLRRRAREADPPPWEGTLDRHRGGVHQLGAWSEKSEGYVAEAVSGRDTLAYLCLMDPRVGEAVADLMVALRADLERDLDVEDGHDACPPEECSAASLVVLARRLNRDLPGVEV